MSEIVQKELDDLKKYLIDKYRANGGTKDLTKFPVAMITNEIDNLSQLNDLKSQVAEYKNTITPRPKIGAVNQSRENQELAARAASVVGNYMDHISPPFDMRTLDDERYLRDNSLLKLGTDNDDPTVVILRDEEGRLA